MMYLFCVTLAKYRQVLVTLALLLCSTSSFAKFIAVSVSSEDNFRNLITDSIEKRADELGDDVYVDVANGDFEVQYDQVKRYLEAGADAIVIFSAGDSKQNRRLLDLTDKVPLIFVNVEPIENLSDLPANAVYVGSNEEQSGTMEMEELARLANYEGNVALLIGEESHPAARMRTQDVKNVLAKYPKMKLAVSKSGNWQRNQAYKIVSDWLKNKEAFKVLVANNDEMILGGIMAIKDAGLDVKSFFTGGVDATKDALLAMEKGDLDVTVLQDAVNQGRVTVDVAYRLINGEKTDKAIWVPFRLVTSENYKQYLK